MATHDPRQAVVASSTLGAIGRFGNQILQYGFLRLYAARHGLALETHPWLGSELFGCREPPVAHGRTVVTELELGIFGGDFENRPPATGCDLWGWFQVDARALAPQRELFRSKISGQGVGAEVTPRRVSSSVRGTEVGYSR